MGSSLSKSFSTWLLTMEDNYNTSDLVKNVVVPTNGANVVICLLDI